MGTALAVTQQQSIEDVTRSRAGIMSTDVVRAAADSWSLSGARICRTTALNAACNVARSSIRLSCRIAASVE